MDLARFHRAVDVITRDADEIGIIKQLDVLINDLNTIASNPGTAQLSQQFKDHLNDLRNALADSWLNDSGEDAVDRLIADLKLHKYVGDGLSQSIVETLQSNQLVPNHAAIALKQVRDDVATKLGQLKNIQTAFDNLGVEYFYLDEGKAEMLIDVPTADEERSLNELGKEAREWHKICEAISETFDPKRTPVRVKTLASGSWLMYVAGAAAFIYGVAHCMKGVNAILSAAIEMRKLVAQLKANNAPEDILKQLDDHSASKVKTEIDHLADKLIAEHYKGTDQGRKNELRNALAQSLNRLSHKFTSGTKVRLEITFPAQPTVGEGEQPNEEQRATLNAIEEMKKVQAEIEAAQSQIDYLQHRDSLQKSLPAPDDGESEDEA